MLTQCKKTKTVVFILPEKPWQSKATHNAHRTSKSWPDSFFQFKTVRSRDINGVMSVTYFPIQCFWIVDPFACLLVFCVFVVCTEQINQIHSPAAKLPAPKGMRTPGSATTITKRQVQAGLLLMWAAIWVNNSQSTWIVRMRSRCREYSGIEEELLLEADGIAPPHHCDTV